MILLPGMDPLTAVRSSTALVVEQAQHVSISDQGKVPVKALFLHSGCDVCRNVSKIGP